jgi:rod shape-determining protein MreC
MTGIRTVFGRNRRLLAYILAGAFLMSIIFSPNFIRPLAGDVAGLFILYPFSELRNYVVGLQGVAEENRRLRNALTEVTTQLSAMAEARRENQRLREFLGFDPPENSRVVPVKIVSMGHQLYPVSALINKGSNDSIRIDQPVINRFGLAGKIKEVMPDFATVQLLTDPSNAVSGRAAESRQLGIVRFSPVRGMYFDNLPADADIAAGDLIITSGLGGIYPAGLTVAVVDSVFVERGEILKEVFLKPAVNLNEIDELYVLFKEPQ